MSKARTNQSATFWIISAIWLLHVIGFIVSNFRDDVQGMVWFGFMGMMWFSMANRERDA